MTGFNQETVDTYVENGWAVLPIPNDHKSPVPKGYTGEDGQDASGADRWSWLNEGVPGWNKKRRDDDGNSTLPSWDSYGEYNVGIRLPNNVIGIDVDAYGDKSGERCLREAERRWGPLPVTVRSTSRTDRVSGIRLYRVPEGTHWRRGIMFPEMNLGGIDIVQATHRYVVSYPSMHPEGRQYLWLDDSCERVEIPRLSDIPELPQAWIEANRITVDEITTRVNPFEQISSMPRGRMTPDVNRAFQEAVKSLTGSPGGRHDALLGKVLWLVRLGTEQQQTGVHQALGELENLFVKKTGDRNSESEARSEFRRMVYGENGHNLIASTPSDEGSRILLGEKAPQASSGPAPLPSGPATPVPDDDTDRAIGELEKQFGKMSEEDAWLLGTGSADSPDEPEREVPPEAPVPQQNRDELPFYDQLYRVGDLAAIQPAEPLVDKLLYRNTLAQLAGDPGSYKTFFTLGLACAVAGPKEKWGTYDIAHHGAVIYVAAEGLSGMRARTLAWCEQQNVLPEKLNLYFFPHAFQLDNWDDMQQVYDMVDKTQAVLIVLDTRARVTLGLDENSAEHQGKAIEAAEQIRQRYGTTVLVVHHSARSGKAGRGSNSWDGAVWTELRGEKDGDMGVKIHCEKHKDAESGCDHYFEMEKRTVEKEAMPGVEKPYRTTLVAVERQGGEPKTAGAPTQEQTGTAAEVIVEVLSDATMDGLNGQDLKRLVIERGITYSAYMKAKGREVNSGRIKEWKDGKTIRYSLPK